MTKDGFLRPFGESKRLYIRTEPDHCPLPFIADITSFHGAKISKLDILKGYYQVPMYRQDIPKTAITTLFTFTLNYSSTTLQGGPFPLKRNGTFSLMGDYYGGFRHKTSHEGVGLSVDPRRPKANSHEARSGSQLGAARLWSGAWPAAQHEWPCLSQRNQLLTGHQSFIFFSLS